MRGLIFIRVIALLARVQHGESDLKMKTLDNCTAHHGIHRSNGVQQMYAGVMAHYGHEVMPYVGNQICIRCILSSTTKY